MQPSLTFLRLDINLQTILTNNKRNNLLSKIELIDFRTLLCEKIHSIWIYVDERCISNFSGIFLDYLAWDIRLLRQH